MMTRIPLKRLLVVVNFYSSVESLSHGIPSALGRVVAVDARASAENTLKNTLKLGVVIGISSS